MPKRGRQVPPPEPNARRGSAAGAKRTGKKNGTSNMCHQCQKNDRGRVVLCLCCRTYRRWRRYCLPCITRWYPRLTEEDFVNSCPSCRNNCNCKACLRTDIFDKTDNFKVSRDDEITFTHRIVHFLLPWLKDLHHKQMLEKSVEATIRGIDACKVEVQVRYTHTDERILCDDCKTSILDFHRRCSSCGYDLCLSCCQELRQYSSRSSRRFSQEKLISDLLDKANSVVCSKTMLEVGSSKCFCFMESGEINVGTSRKSACRESPSDNYIYCPAARDVKNGALDHFQHHWLKGQPVIVRDVLELTSGLSWEPMVMWRALREQKEETKKERLFVKALECLTWSEIEVNIHNFFDWYSCGIVGSEDLPSLIKLEDWPEDSTFEERLPRHHVEFISALPFREYTHPINGPLNLAIKLPEKVVKPDLGPKICIAYGVAHELGMRDSVTKIHSDMSDTVNILTHTAKIKLKAQSITAIEKMKKSMAFSSKDTSEPPNDAEEGTSKPTGWQAHDKQHGSPHSSNATGKRNKPILEPEDDDLPFVEENGPEGGALWDIFRREDVSKLHNYLLKHREEFRHYNCEPVKQVTHPIHDQCFYLTNEHKRKLKEEYGVEAWTFEQKLGEAVLIPAGCPHQVRNLKSCIKVALNFVSPENLNECIKLREEFRRLPEGHIMNEDKLEVNKIALHALRKAIMDIDSDFGRYGFR